MKSYILGCAAVIGALGLIAMSKPAEAIGYTLVYDSAVLFPDTSIGYQAPDFLVGPPAPVVDSPTTSAGGVYRSPWDTEGSPYDGLEYTSVRSGTIGYNLTGTLLSFFWGSPDTYNTLTFYEGADGTGDSVSLTGSILSNLGAGHHWVSFLTTEAFRSVTFSSTSAAFEFANVTATPLPAALPLFATGLGVLGFGRMRRKVTGMRDWLFGPRQDALLA